MSFASLLVLAVGLAMDTAAVAAGCGLRVGRRMDAFGGAVLLLFGCRILVEHLGVN